MNKTFILKNHRLGEIFAKTSESKNKYGQVIEDRFKTVLVDSFDNLLASEEKIVEPKFKKMFDLDITTELPYRQKGFGLGELLRLESIKEMIKGGIENFRLLSKDSAVYFHAKYKFVPEITKFSERDDVLKMIIADEHPLMVGIREEAQKLSEYVTQNKENPQALRDACKPASAIAQCYLERVLSHKLPLNEHPITTNIDMILTRENVLKNKNFFNKLYEKHSLDYKVE